MNDRLMLLAEGLTKSFFQNATEVEVLKGVNLQLAVGEQVAIVGRSGSGKSSLLHLLAGLDSADSGSVKVDGVDLLAADANGRARIRREKMGFVYQQHHLLAEFSAQENVAIPQQLLGVGESSARQAARDMLALVGLEERLNHLPSELSGGERQRVAVARALVNKPQVVLADEPTGSLDRTSAELLMDLLSNLSRAQGTSFVVVTHDVSMLQRFDRVASLEAGILQPLSSLAESMRGTGTLSLWMAARLIIRGGRGFSRFVSWVSVIGLTLGVMSLTAVMAVMNGFDQELKQRLLGSVPHITMTNARSTERLLEFAQADPRIRQMAPYFQGFGVITQSGRSQPVTAVALTSAGFKAQPQLVNAMSEGALGSLGDVPNGVLMGKPLARALAVVPGDDLSLLLAVPRRESLGSTLLRLKIVGTFELGADPDYSLLLMNLDAKPMDDWQALGQTGLRLQLHDALAAQSVVDDLAPAAKLFAGQSEVAVSSWIDEYGDLFQAVALEKTLMGTLLLLVIAIAGFNIVAGQIMMVNDKRADIAILRTMGADQALVRNVFLLQGSLVGLVGTTIGLAVGVLVAQQVNEIVDALEWLSGRHLLEGSYFVTVPSQIHGSDLLLTGLAAGGLAVWAAWLPAHRASQMNPLENLKV